MRATLALNGLNLKETQEKCIVFPVFSAAIKEFIRDKTGYFPFFAYIMHAPDVFLLKYGFKVFHLRVWHC